MRETENSTNKNFSRKKKKKNEVANRKEDISLGVCSALLRSAPKKLISHSYRIRSSIKEGYYLSIIMRPLLVKLHSPLQITHQKKKEKIIRKIVTTINNAIAIAVQRGSGQVSSSLLHISQFHMLQILQNLSSFSHASPSPLSPKLTLSETFYKQSCYLRPTSPFYPLFLFLSPVPSPSPSSPPPSQSPPP